jgi:hypothetical protein
MERSQPSTDIQKTHKGHKTNTEKTHIDHTGLIKPLTLRDLGVLFLKSIRERFRAMNGTANLVCQGPLREPISKDLPATPACIARSALNRL